MEEATMKRLANINGKMNKKTVSMFKTLATDDDKATGELVRQIGTLATEMTAVANRYTGTSLPLPKTDTGKGSKMDVTEIQERIEEILPRGFDVHKVVRNNGTTTVYFEPTDKQYATDCDVKTCEDVTTSAGFSVVANGSRLIDDSTAIAVAITDCNVKQTEKCDDDVLIPNREKMLEVITMVVARAVDVVNRHTDDKDPSVRKLESAIGFKHDLKFLIKRRFEQGSKEYAHAKNLYGVIKTLEDMMDSGDYAAIQQVDKYRA